MGKMVQALSRDAQRSCLLYFVVAAVVIPLGCICIFVPLGIAQNANLGDGATLLVLIVPMGLFFLLVFGGSIGGAFWMLRRRGHWLDAIFEPLGLTGRSYLMSGRRYDGLVGGRQIDVRLVRGPSLTFYVDTPLMTRVNVGEASRVGQSLARAFNREPLATSDPRLDGLVVYGIDEAWTQALLAQPEVPPLLERMVKEESSFLIHQVHLQPGTFLFRLYRNRALFKLEITPGQAQSWLNDLLALIRIAESLPPPTVTAEPNRLEKMAR